MSRLPKPRYDGKGIFTRTVVSSIADDTMDRKKLGTICRDIERMRRSQPKAVQLQRLARRFERREASRGKHPIYVSDAFPNLRPLSIPNHKGRDLPEGTKRSILDQLEAEDVEAWSNLLDDLEGTNGNRRNGE